MTNDEIYAAPDIELVVNTTYPTSHYKVAKEALLAGKSVYTEKMICATLDEVNELVELAKQKNLFFGGAPDTYFGSGIQMARNIIDSEMIGAPVMAQAFLSRSYHHERHYTGEEKRFAFCKNGGILFDMGSYYLTAFVFLLGSVKSVTGYSAIRDPDRVYQNPRCPLYGQNMTVESTNISTGSLLFENGVMGNITMLSESAPQNHFYVYCTDGYIDLGDPNEYDKTVRIVNKRGEESVVNSTFGIDGGNRRGYGAAEAMYARIAGREARCSGELCRHVLEVALGLIESSESGNTYRMTTSAKRPEPFRQGYTENAELSLK
jgi:predicted dehydrogenase